MQKPIEQPTYTRIVKEIRRNGREYDVYVGYEGGALEYVGSRGIYLRAEELADETAMNLLCDGVL